MHRLGGELPGLFAIITLALIVFGTTVAVATMEEIVLSASRQHSFTIGTHGLHTAGVLLSPRPAKPARREDDMLSRRTILGSVAVLGLGLVTVVAAFGQGMGHGRPAMMKRMVIGDDRRGAGAGQVTADQRARRSTPRATACSPRWRRNGRRAARAWTRRWPCSRPTRSIPAAWPRSAAQREAEHRQVADAISQAITEVHDVLNPAQRKAVADWTARQPAGDAGIEGLIAVAGVSFGMI